MNWLSSFIIANLIGLGSNLDNCGVGIAYGTENVTLQHWVNAMINMIGFCTALLGSFAGNVISHCISEETANWVACLMLCSIGCFFLYSAYVRPRISSQRVQWMKLQEPGFKEALILGVALSFTNVASGFSATVTNATAV